jgi:hypothetical protein
MPPPAPLAPTAGVTPPPPARNADDDLGSLVGDRPADPATGRAGADTPTEVTETPMTQPREDRPPA